jgi:hypothetical protein
MFAIHPSRRALGRCRTILVWALVPISVVNGQTIVGCGCTGHYQAACQCAACEPAARADHSVSQACDSKAGGPKAHACCCHKDSADSSNASSDSPSRSLASPARNHPCARIILHTGGSILAVSPQLGDLDSLSGVVPAALDTLRQAEPAGIRFVVLIDGGPPPRDIVVTLHRLVI